MEVQSEVNFYLVCYTLWCYVVDGQQDFDNDQSSETDGGLTDFGRNPQIQNSRLLRFEDFFGNSPSSNSDLGLRGASTRNSNTGNDFGFDNFNSQFRNFGQSQTGNSRNFGQSSNFDTDDGGSTETGTGVSSGNNANSRNQQRNNVLSKFRSSSDDRFRDSSSFENFGSRFSNLDGFSSTRTRQRSLNTTPRPSSARRSLTRSDDDTGAASFSFFSRSFN